MSMTAEVIFSFCLLIFCTLPIFILGIVQYNSKKPVAFWSGKEPHKPDEISDVRAYNHRHGMIWILYGAGFILSFTVGYFIKENQGIAIVVLTAAESLGGLAAAIAYHNRLEQRYFTGRDEG